MVLYRLPVTFIIIEDDKDHALLLKETLRQSKPSNKIIHFTTGEEGLSYLHEYGKHQSDSNPHIVILDLNLPEMSGLEVLQAIKADLVLKHIPVVVLTTSSNEDDKARAYGAGANSYLVKPLAYGTFQDLIQELNRYWSEQNQPMTP